jgi:hypothetical protein
MSEYGRRQIVDAGFDKTLLETMRAVQLEGLDILTRFDLREHVQRQVHHDCRRYVLLQVASSDLLLRAIQTDIESGPSFPRPWQSTSWPTASRRRDHRNHSLL